MVGIAQRDIQLKEAAVRRAGGIAALAMLLGVSPGAVSQWGRTRPIPRHVRPRLEDYLRARRSNRGEPGGWDYGVLGAHRELQERLGGLLRPEEAADVEKLPPRYRERYRERLKEIQAKIDEEIRAKLGEMIANVERELADFRARLVAEYRAQRRGST